MNWCEQHLMPRAQMKVRWERDKVWRHSLNGCAVNVRDFWIGGWGRLNHNEMYMPIIWACTSHWRWKKFHFWGKEYRIVPPLYVPWPIYAAVKWVSWFTSYFDLTCILLRDINCCLASNYALWKTYFLLLTPLFCNVRSAVWNRSHLPHPSWSF